MCRLFGRQDGRSVDFLSPVLFHRAGSYPRRECLVNPVESGGGFIPDLSTRETERQETPLLSRSEPSLGQRISIL